MFSDDEDFGFPTGGFGDLDGDGDIDSTEYMSEEDDFQRTMQSREKDNCPIFGDIDDDWEISCLDIATEYGLNPYDYADVEEFAQALELARAINDDETDTFNFSDLSCDGTPINQVFGVSEENECNNTPTKQQSSQSIERRYYDNQNCMYRIGDAIHDNFNEVSESYEKHECENFSLLIQKIYSVDKKLGISIWVWAIHNFPSALVNNGVAKWNSQASSLSDNIFSNFATTDEESDDEEERTFIFRYVSKNPDLEEIIFNKTYVDEHLFSLTKYVPYCIKNNLRDNFLRVYNGIMTNRFRDEKKMSKYSIIEEILIFCGVGVHEADPWFYAFFEKEIKALNKPLKEAYLMKSLNREEWGRRVFLKPEN